MNAEYILLKDTNQDLNRQKYIEKILLEFSTAQNKLKVHSKDTKFFKHILKANYDEYLNRIEESILTQRNISFLKNALQTRYKKFRKSYNI